MGKSRLYFSKMEVPQTGRWLVLINHEIVIDDDHKQVITIPIECANLDDCDALLSGMHSLIETYKFKNPSHKKFVNDPSLINQ